MGQRAHFGSELAPFSNSQPPRRKLIREVILTIAKVHGESSTAMPES